MTPIRIGEIHVPGRAGLGTVRCLTLTSPPSRDGSLELFFALFAAEAPKKVLERLTDRLGEEVRSVFFQKGNPEARFEAALKQANKTILAFLYEHGLSLPGIKLRGAAAALAKGTLFVASRGALRGLLYMPRDGRLVPHALFQETADKPGEPKFFTSLQAGAFPAGARFMIATSELFHTLDDAYARDMLGQTDFAKASRDVKNVLRGADKPVSILSLSSLLAEETLGAASGIAEGEIEPGTESTPRSARRSAPTIGPDIGELIARGLRSVLRLAGRGLAALAMLLWRMLKSLGRLPLKIPGFFAMLSDRQRRAIFFSDCVHTPDRWMSSAIGRLNALPSKSRGRFFILIALGAVFLHGILFSIRHEAKAQVLKAYEAQLAELQQLDADFAAGMIYDNDSRARELLARMETVWNALPEASEAQKKTKEEAGRALAKAREQLRRVVVVEKPAAFATLGESGAGISSMSWFGGKLYAFSRASGRVRIFSETGAPQADAKLDSLPTGVTAAAPARTGFLLQSASGTLLYWNPQSAEEVPYTATDAKDAPILFYQGRLYAAGADGAVTRRAVAASNLGAASDVLRGAPPSPVSLAADGALYLLYRNGSTRKYLKGASVQNYAPSAIDPAASQAAFLWASSASDKLVFIDQGGDRIFSVDKTTGHLSAQFTAPEFKNLRAIAVDDAGRAAYVLAESGTIYKVSLK